MRCTLLVFLLVCAAAGGYAQSLSNLRRSVISTKVDTVQIDTLSIAPGTFRVSNGEEAIDTAAFTLDFINSKLVWKKKSVAFQAIMVDSVVIQYRVFSFLFSKPYVNKDLNLIGRGSSSGTGYYSPGTGQPELFRVQGLTKNGSISRGITFGNNQDVFVNSSLNLQLAGKLSDNVEILAAITDENIPIQPEGNTQQLQDFDRVFIQISDSTNKLIAGDFDLRRPDSYFMNFLKRGQGASYSGIFNLSEQPKVKKRILKAGSAIAVSKGKFSRQQLAVIEGNQGPYRLTGNNGENFIIILAGSERVYLDGQLLTRGLQNDYVIDYNTAEIIFTARRLVTKDIRISLEFEYTDRNYARSLLYANTEFESDKLKLKLNLYSEQDSKNQPLTIQLDSAKKQLMADIGDSIQYAFISTADSVVFNSTNVLYQKKDTVSNGVIFTIYQYSTNPDRAFWQVNFSNVGVNRGNYIQEINAANGRVYRWVTPINGIPQGTFEPVTLLVTPKKQQLATFGSDYIFNKNNSITAEVGLSNYDVNLFSKKDKSNDEGLAGRINYTNTIPLSGDSANGWRLQNKVGFEFVNRNFKPLERFRNVEFERDWNINSASIYADEKISSFQTTLVNPKTGSFSYQLRSYTKGVYNGLMNSGNTNLTWNRFMVKANASYLSTKGVSNRTTFLRHYADVARSLGRIVVGVRENTEYNRFLNSTNRILFSNSYSFEDYQVYLNKSDSSKSKAGISYKKRIDRLPSNENLKLSAVAEEMNFFTDFSSNPRNSIRTMTTYRSLVIKDTILTRQEPGKILLNRIDHTATFRNGIVSAVTYYEVGTGQERRQEYYYLEVPAGQGVYAYIGDLNGNNVKDVDEFAIAAFSFQAKYIRVYVQTNNYISTRSNQFSEILTLSPAGNKSSSTGTVPLLHRFSNQTSVRLEKKTKDEALLSSLNPFNRTINDTSLVSTTTNVRNILYFNRTNPYYGLDFTLLDNRNKSFLANGFETRMLVSRTINIRWNVNRAVLVALFYENGEKSNRSEFFTSRDYKIFFDGVEPKITLQPGNSFRLSAAYKYTSKRNSIGNKEVTFLNRFILDAKYTTVNAGNINAKISVVNVKYGGSETSFLTYELLEGFKPGRNLTWGAAVQRNLGSSMQLSLNYDGTKLQGSPAVHTGGVQFRAFF